MASEKRRTIPLLIVLLLLISSHVYAEVFNSKSFVVEITRNCEEGGSHL